jgi:hypothetical protein
LARLVPVIVALTPAQMEGAECAAEEAKLKPMTVDVATATARIPTWPARRTTAAVVETRIARL